VCKSLLVFHWNCVCISYRFWRDLETASRGRSRSLEMAPYDRPYTTFYWSAIVYIALSGTVFELLDVEKYRNLEIWVRSHWRSFKLVPFESLAAVSYSPSIVTMAVSLTVYNIWYSASKYSVTLKTGWRSKSRFFTNISLYLRNDQVRAIVTIGLEGEYETVPKLSNCACHVHDH